MNEWLTANTDHNSLYASHGFKNGLVSECTSVVVYNVVNTCNIYTTNVTLCNATSPMFCLSSDLQNTSRDVRRGMGGSIKKHCLERFQEIHNKAMRVTFQYASLMQFTEHLVVRLHGWESWFVSGHPLYW